MTEKYPLDTIGGYGPVVQLDRMLPSEGKDRWFESNRVRQEKDSEVAKWQFGCLFLLGRRHPIGRRMSIEKAACRYYHGEEPLKSVKVSCKRI